MSGTGAAPPDRALDALAGEYVLGTLDANEVTVVRRAMATDPVLVDAVSDWERRLAPLSDLALEEAPPPDLWSRIERSIRPGMEGRARSSGLASWRLRLLGGWAIGATVAAAALGVVILRGGPSAPMMTVLLSDRTQLAWTAAFDRDGALRLAAVPSVGGAEQPTPDDRVLQLWALPPGATAPTSLGLLPRGQRTVSVQAPPVKPVPGMLIEITLEPTGGSPTGRPTGPVQFIGRLSQPGPNS